MFSAAEWQQEEVLSVNGVKPTSYWNYNYNTKYPLLRENLTLRITKQSTSLLKL